MIDLSSKEYRRYGKYYDSFLNKLVIGNKKFNLYMMYTDIKSIDRSIMVAERKEKINKINSNI